MKDIPVFKCFETLSNCYFYDRNMHTIVHIPRDLYNVLLEVEKGNVNSEAMHIIKDYNEKGLLLNDDLSEIEHPDTLYLPHIVRHKIAGLILQVTQNCNLRCSYCAYSGAYKNRGHQPQSMTFGQAKNGIDYVIERNDEMPHFYCAFYGGEPLLEFSLIKECVEYIESLNLGKIIIYNITTNGTILTEEIMRFFVEHNFNVMISLDGDKNTHDANRRFISGKGSFDIILQNVKRMRSLYPDYVKKSVKFNAVINTKTNIKCMDETFNIDDIFSDSNIMFNEVSQNNLLNKDIAFFEENYRIKYRFEMIKLYLSMLKKIDTKFVSKLVKNNMQNIKDTYIDLQKHVTLGRKMHPQGPCIPGVNRLLVNVDGYFYPCEKVPELDEWCIGNMEHGLNVDKIRFMMNIAKATEDKCKDCWALRLCYDCATKCDCTNERACRISKLCRCGKQKEDAINQLTEITVLSELGFDLEVKEL